MKGLSLVLTAFALALASTVAMALHTEEVEYSANGTTLKGYLAYDDQVKGKRPGVLVVHEWWGHNDYVRKRAEMLAALGYTALAIDMYGDGKQAAHPEDAGKFAGEVRKNMPVAKARFLAAMELLQKHPTVATDNVAAIGYCFGGGIVLEMARAGVDLDGVVSFHGGLFPPSADDMQRIKSPILILHGAADPYVKQETIAAVLGKLETAGADWQMIYYAEAVHAFTNPEAGDDPSTGVAFQQQAAERSWKHMQLFFEEIFASTQM